MFGGLCWALVAVLLLVMADRGMAQDQPPQEVPWPPPVQRAELDEISVRAKDLFDNYYCRLPDFDAAASSPDGATLAWNQAYIMKGYLGMYEGTRDHRYLQPLLEQIPVILANRNDRLGVVDELRSRVMPAWVTSAYGGPPQAYMVHAGMILYPMVRLAVVLKQDPALARLHAELIARILADAEQTIQAYEGEWREGPGEDEGYYWCPDLKADLPFNQQNSMGRLMLAMYAATGEERYRDRAAKLARWFKYRLRMIGGQQGRYIWDYWTHRADFEDQTHTGLNVDFAHMCYRAGIVFTNADIRRFINAFRYVAVDCGFSDYLDGRGRDKGWGIWMQRWMHLAHEDGSLRTIMLDYVTSHRDESYAGGAQACGLLVETQFRDNVFYAVLAAQTTSDMGPHMPGR